jgi:hypothetical protein
MAITLTMRKRCVMPRGTAEKSEDVSQIYVGEGARKDKRRSSSAQTEEDPGGIVELTMSVVMEIFQLVAPLGENSERIFEEGDNDQEAPNCREIANVPKSSPRELSASSSSILPSH